MASIAFPCSQPRGLTRLGNRAVALGLLTFAAPLLGASLPNERIGITSPMALLETAGDRYQIQAVAHPGVRYLETRSQREVTVGLDRLEHERLQGRSFTLSSPDDFAYLEPQAASRVGSEQQVVGFTAAQQPLIEARLHLLFATPLQPDRRYVLDISQAPGLQGDPQDCRALPLSYRPERISGSIQLDQLGYAPGADKIAFLGHWLGTAGPLPIDNLAFEVVTEPGQRLVFQGRAQLRAESDPWSGHDVYTADFSALRAPGRYRLRVAGLGLSDEFRIAPDVYDPVYRRVMRLFYHSRNSSPILAPWADPGYERPQGGIPPAMDGVFHEAVGSSPLGHGELAGSYRPVSRGWFDAGDFGQYVTNAAPVWYLLGAAMDLAPQRFGDGDLNIPESGNGIPDLLDELEWGLDWLLAMQDQADGGVYWRLASATWDDVPPHRIGQPRLIAEKTTPATAAFVAAGAIHARLLRPWRPERAAQVLQAARAAWDFLDRHPQWPPEGQTYHNPKGIRAGEYPDPSALDARLWAAAELYRTTGESRYRTAYEELAAKVKVDPTGNVSFKDQGLAAYWAYLMAPWPDREPSLVAQARSALLAGADWRVRRIQEHPFLAPVHPFIGWVGWGSFAHSSRATLPLLQAFSLSGEPAYLKAAWQSVHSQLGANPQGLCYITGLGARSPRYPLSKLSQMDQVEASLGGIPVHGPHFHLPALWGAMRAVNDGYYPPERPSASQPKTAADFLHAYPVLRRYTDADLIPPMSEPTIVEYAYTAMALALLDEGRTGFALLGGESRSPGGVARE